MANYLKPKATQNKYSTSDSDEKKGYAPYERAGPTLLSQQPNSLPAKQEGAPKPGWQALKGHLEGRLASLRTWRQSWWTGTWSDLSQYIQPRRSIWLTQSSGGLPTPNSMSRGRGINESIVDPTGTFATRICSGGLMSGLASPSRPWFKVLPSLKNISIDAAGRVWLDEIESRMYTILAGSNFYNSFAQECEDLVVFGTAPTIIYEDEIDVIRCYNPCIGEYYLSSGATMRVDGLYRTFLMTVAQIVDFFELVNCPQEIQNMWAQKGNSLEKEYIIAHSIEPNFAIGGDNDTVIDGNFDWRETYWLYGQGDEKPLSLRGFVDKPFTAARWSTQSNDAYGRSPGMDVLPDVIQLQVMTRRMAEAIEKQVRPPLIADMQLKNSPSSILPGHVTYVQNLGTGTGMRPIYDVNPDVQYMSVLIQQISARIKIGLFNDLFLMLENGPQAKMTAYEVAQKVQEKMQVVGPVIEGLLSESLKPKLKRIFAIAKRRGLIPPPPDSLKGVPLDIEFVSMLALSQKAAATGGLERIAALVGNLASVFPEARDKFDVDNFIDEMNDLLGNPQKVIRGAEQVAEIRKAQAEKQQAVDKMAAMQQGAATAATGAQAAQVLANTEVGGGVSALQGIIGQG